MPIMAVHEQNDARGTARLLAAAAMSCVENPAVAPRNAVAINNVYRLLEAFRTQAFFGLEAPHSTLPADSADALTLFPTVERHVKDVRDALENALATAFAGVPKGQALDQIEDVLRAITYPDEFERPLQENLEKVAGFFRQFAERLQATAKL